MDRLMEQCIRKCWDCRHECQRELYTHCVYQGGPHMDADHVKLMTDCIQICQVTADFMTRESKMHMAVCDACIAVCEACANSCRVLGMDNCADACTSCAIACRQMAFPNQNRLRG